MRNPARWIAIIASFFTACAVQATTTKPSAHHPRERSAHATYRTVRYARQTSSTATHTSHPSSTKKTHHYVRHHYVRHRYVRRRRYYRHRVRLPSGPTPERITQIQTALARGGYYKGDPTGKWDADTVAAVQKFQSANNIDATGKLDAPTLQKLGLGSDIAGVAAPKTVVPKISNGAPASTPAMPGKPAGSANPSPASGHVQSAAAISGGTHGSSNATAASSTANSSGKNSSGTNSSAANSAPANSGGGASGASAIAPSTTSSGADSDSTSASKPAADQH